MMETMASTVANNGITGVKLEIDEAHYTEAYNRAGAIPALANSHRGAEAVLIGCLGEVMFEEYLRNNGVFFLPQLRETTHDYLVGKQYFVFEVKAKDRTVPPRPDYECSVPLYNYDHQVVDGYAFLSLERTKGTQRGLKRFHSCWFVGVVSRKNFEQKSVTRKKDEVDLRNGTKFWTACKNIYIRDLSPPDVMVKHFQN
jgi:hypothetical protein